MKKLIISAALIAAAGTAHAGLSCSTDYWGNTYCTGTGSDSGYSSTTTEDYWGNQTTTDNQGNSYRCSTDYWGNVTCN